MTVLVAPPPSNRLTGGYRFNDRLATHLATRGDFLYREVAPEELARGVRAVLGTPDRAAPVPWQADDKPGRGGAPPIPVLLDSLYFDIRVGSTSGLQALRQDPRFTCGILTHLVPPTESRSRLFPLMDFYIVPSRYVARHVAELGAPPERVFRCPPGVDALELKPEERFEPVSGPLKLLTVSNDTETKNLPWLAGLLGELREVSWEWHVVGTRGAFLTDALLEELGIADRTRCHGALEPHRVSELMRESGALLHPSAFESYGMVIAEAIVHHLPIVANDTGAIPELVVNGENGILCPAGDREAWFAAVSDVITTPALRERLRSAAAHSAQGLATWSAAADCVEAALAHITKTALPPKAAHSRPAPGAPGPPGAPDADTHAPDTEEEGL